MAAYHNHLCKDRIKIFEKKLLLIQTTLRIMRRENESRKKILERVEREGREKQPERKER